MVTDGAIHVLGGLVTEITITDGGSGYTPSGGPFTITLTGGGSGATAVCYSDGGGVIHLTSVTNPGSGYPSAPLATFDPPSGPGTTATGTAVVDLGGGAVTDDGTITVQYRLTGQPCTQAPRRPLPKRERIQRGR